MTKKSITKVLFVLSLVLMHAALAQKGGGVVVGPGPGPITLPTPPGIAFLSPTGDPIMAPGARPLLSVSADSSAPDDAVVKVEFFDNLVLVGSGALYQSSAECGAFSRTRVQQLVPGCYFFQMPAMQTGVHRLEARATTYKRATGSAYLTITIGTEVVPAWRSPADGATVANQAVTLSADVSTTVPISRVEFRYKKDGVTQTIRSVTKGADGHYSYLWSGMAPGSYDLWFVAWDAYGPVKSSGIRKIRVNARPTGAFVKPAASEVITAGKPYTIDVDAFDSDGIVKSVVVTDGAGLSLSLPGPAYSATWQNPTAGAHALAAKIVDDVGGFRNISRQVRVNAPPTAAISAPASSIVGQPVTITATASDAEGPVSVDFLVDGVVKGHYSGNGPTFTHAWTGTPVGTHTLKVVVKDSDLAPASAARSIEIKPLPNTAPNLSLSSPADNTAVPGGAPIVFQGLASDPDAGGYVDHVTITDTRTGQVLTITAQQIVGGAFSVTWAQGITSPTDFSVQAFDDKQAPSQVVTRHLVVDTPATVALLTPFDPDGLPVFYKGQDIDLKARAEDADGIAQLVFAMNDVQIATAQRSTVDPSEFTARWHVDRTGQYSLTAKVFDSAANPAVASAAQAMQLLGSVGTNVVAPPASICTAARFPVVSGSTPTTPGSWWNPARWGTGWEFFYQHDGKLSLEWFTFGQDKQPVWLASSEPVLIPAGRKTWQDTLIKYRNGGSEHTTVGSAALTLVPGDPTRVAIRWQWGEAGAIPYDECIKDYSRAAPTGEAPTEGSIEQDVEFTTTFGSSANANMAYSGPWYEPERPGYGVFLSIVRSADVATYVENAKFAVYDDSGDPVWLYAQGAASSSPPATSTNATLSLAYLTSKNGVPVADCSNVNCVTFHNGTGTWQRRYTVDEASAPIIEQVLSIDTGAAQPALPAGAVGVTGFVAPTAEQLGDPAHPPFSTLVRASDSQTVLVDRTQCEAARGETCSVTINWISVPTSSDPVRAIYRRDCATHAYTLVSSSASGEKSVEIAPGQCFRFELHRSMQAGPWSLLYSTHQVRGLFAGESNQPSVHITSPSTQTKLDADQSVMLSVSLENFTDLVTYVDYVVGDTVECHAAVPPFSCSWTPPSGTHLVTAVAHTASSQVASDGAVELFVGEPIDTSIHVKSTGGSVTNYADTFSDRIKSAEAVGPLGDDLFGESINYYTGATEFEQTDLDIPGNSSLPVRVTRRYTVQQRKFDPFGHALGDWEIDVPFMSGTYATAAPWVVNTTEPTRRCSSPQNLTQAAPPARVLWQGYEIWQGTTLHVPGAGDQSVLFNADGRLKPRSEYPWVTRDLWLIGCLTDTLATESSPFEPALQNHDATKGVVGEGFVATSPDGTRYTFAWMSAHEERSLRSSEHMATSDGQSVLAFYELPRSEIRLYATRVEDRFGNWVAYDWEGGLTDSRLVAIRAGSGADLEHPNRSIRIHYDASHPDRVSNVVGAGRTVSYGYVTSGSNEGGLQSVTYADGSAWTLDLAGLYEGGGPGSGKWEDPTVTPDWIHCAPRRQVPNTTPKSISMHHPSGAVADFDFTFTRHIRSNVPERFCFLGGLAPPAGIAIAGDTNPDEEWQMTSSVPRTFTVLAATRKRISGAGLTHLEWTFAYDNNNRSGDKYIGYNYLPTTRSVEVSAPDATTVRYTFGRSYGTNEGQLLSVETTGPTASRTETTMYVPVVDPVATPVRTEGFPTRVGVNPNLSLDNFQTELLLPVKAERIEQDGLSFEHEVESFNGYGLPTRTVNRTMRGDATLFSRTETQSYSDYSSDWVLNLPASRSVVVGASTTEVERNEYDDAGAHLPLHTYRYGRKIADMTYHPDGNLWTLTDAKGGVTTLDDYKAGIPRSITLPSPKPTDVAPTLSATVDDGGLIRTTTDSLNAVTTYDYDAVGRLRTVTYPSGDEADWLPKSIQFSVVDSDEYVVGKHWVQTTTQGNFARRIVLDALWRPVVTEQYDIANQAATRRLVAHAFDHAGRETFTSYPAESWAADLPGVHQAFDVLGRLVGTSRSAEGMGADDDPTVAADDLITTVVYGSDESGYSKSVEDARGYRTLTHFRTYDAPDESLPIEVVQGVDTDVEAKTTIARNVFGLPTAIERSGTFNGAPVSETRRYYYDSDQRLCIQVDPESGESLFEYDAVGNLTGSATREPVDEATRENQCSSAATRATAWSALSRTLRSYDGLSRLERVDYPADAASGTAASWIEYTYYADGALKSTVTDQGVEWSYAYNKRRLLDSETATIPGSDAGAGSKSFIHRYDAYGHESSLTYPDGTSVDFSPNVFGEPTKVGGFASDVDYYPNGSVASFNYGNGLQRLNLQNVRQLIYQTSDGTASSAVHEYEYRYDANGNVTSISDPLRGVDTRTMGYDALNRLTSATGRWDDDEELETIATYGYDPLDNLRSAAIRGRQLTYLYNDKWQLDRIDNTGSGDSYTFDHDLRGNQTRKNTTSYTFNMANRLLGVPALNTSYQYDGHGRRVLQDRNGVRKYSLYTQDGIQRGGFDAEAQATSWQFYLSSKLVATKKIPVDGGAATVTYHHTDALGTPVADTDGNGAVIRRTRYTPYGEAINRVVDGPGYTGHVEDEDTGLVYMQQRYYDPEVGRFVSVDPVAVNGGELDNFNRYAYATNNPFANVDPDGRRACLDVACSPNAWPNRPPFPSPCDMCVFSNKNGLGANKRAQLKKATKSKLRMFSLPGESIGGFEDRVSDEVRRLTDQTDFEHRAVLLEKLDSLGQTIYAARIQTQGAAMNSVVLEGVKGWRPILMKNGWPLTIHAHPLGGAVVTKNDLLFPGMEGLRVGRATHPNQYLPSDKDLESHGGILATPNGRREF